MKHLSPLLKGPLYVAFVLISLCSVTSFVAAQTCVQPPEGLVSWWPGEGNAQDSIGPNDGTLQGGTTFAPGMVGQAFSLDGVNSFVQAPTANFPTGNSDRTLELWVNLEAVVAEEAFFAGYGAFGEFDQVYFLGASGNTVFFSQWGTGVEGPSLETGVWYHVAATNVGDSATLYVNGVPVGTATVPINTASGTPFFMGRIPGELGDTRRLQGLVDEVSIYNRALTAEEIQAIFNAGSAGKCKSVPLTPMAAQATLSVGALGGTDTFALQAAFILGDGSNGLNPLTETVVLQVGPTTLTIPADAFHSPSDGVFAFAGVVEGVTLQVTLTRLTRATFEVVAHGEGATLSGIAVPVKVGLAIGDDSGSTTLPLADVSARTPPLQR